MQNLLFNPDKVYEWDMPEAYSLWQHKDLAQKTKRLLYFTAAASIISWLIYHFLLRFLPEDSGFEMEKQILKDLPYVMIIGIIPYSVGSLFGKKNRNVTCKVHNRGIKLFNGYFNKWKDAKLIGEIKNHKELEDVICMTIRLKAALFPNVFLHVEIPFEKSQQQFAQEVYDYIKQIKSELESNILPVLPILEFSKKQHIFLIVFTTVLSLFFVCSAVFHYWDMKTGMDYYWLFSCLVPGPLGVLIVCREKLFRHKWTLWMWGYTLMSFLILYIASVILRIHHLS